jgi:hypothetical protein
MNLQYIFDQLSTGELSDTALASNDDGGIDCGDTLKVTLHIEMGLTALYRRFRLLTKSIDVVVDDSTRNYSIMESDLFKIEKILDAEKNEIFPSNTSDIDSIKTLSMHSFIVPVSMKPQTLQVLYRANHPRIDKAAVEFQPADVQVYLPETHLEALLYFVASRVMNPIGISGEFHEGNNYSAKYERACLVLESHNYQTDNQEQHDKFTSRGWV